MKRGRNAVMNVMSYSTQSPHGRREADYDTRCRTRRTSTGGIQRTRVPPEQEREINAQNPTRTRERAGRSLRLCGAAEL